VRTILEVVARRASVTKAVNPHNFRHSRATHLAQHLTEAQMNEFFGWVQGSDMPSTYVHLSGRDMDRALLKINNVVPDSEAQRETEFTSRRCPRCDLDNPPANMFCSRCGMVLDEREARQMMVEQAERSRADGILDDLLRDPEVRAVLAGKLRRFPAGSGQSGVNGEPLAQA
jgi:hypothetical protein